MEPNEQGAMRMNPDSTLVRDVVVVLPGIMGSELYRGDTPVWSLKPGSVLAAITTLGRDLKTLCLPEGIGEEEPGDYLKGYADLRDLILGMNLPNLRLKSIIVEGEGHLLAASPAIVKGLKFMYGTK
jgi:hypothetical protein